jgi:hypothetical protein
LYDKEIGKWSGIKALGMKARRLHDALNNLGCQHRSKKGADFVNLNGARVRNASSAGRRSKLHRSF